MTDILLALSLPSLPSLSDDGAMLLTVVLGPVTLVVGLCAMLALGSLRAMSRTADRLADQLEAELPTLERRIAATRGRLSQMNSDTERALWALPTIDQRLALAARQLGDLRAELDEWRGPAGEGVSRTLSGIRGTLRALNVARRLGRVIQR
ncbi:hypothetical protein BH23CHL7_BH23CHL7_13310 [soil metagenome]